MSISAPASEIVKRAEEQLVEAQKKRQAALDLIQEASLIEEQAKTSTIASMGSENGLMAFELARWSVSAQATSLTSGQVAVETLKVSTGEVEKSPVVVKQAGKGVNAKQTAPQNKEKYFGANVPPSRIEEADEILIQVAAYVSQGRKGNPFASDRGKNAWRKALFSAAYGNMTTNNEQDAIDDTFTASKVDELGGENIPSISSDYDNETLASGKVVKDYSRDEFNELSIEENNKLDENEEFIAPHLEDIIDEIDVFIEPDEDIYNDYQNDDVVDLSVNTEKQAPFDNETRISGQLAADQDEPYNNLSQSELEDAVTYHSSNSQVDPFDDYDDELPPVNPAPPPRGVVSSTFPLRRENSISHRPASPESFIRSGFGQVSSDVVGEKDVSEQSIDQEDDVITEETSALPKAHVPRPIPPHRRPGNGQALQQPMTLPSAISGSNVKPDGTSQKPFSPPSFLKRKT